MYPPVCRAAQQSNRNTSDAEECSHQAMNEILNWRELGLIQLVLSLVLPLDYLRASSRWQCHACSSPFVWGNSHDIGVPTTCKIFQAMMEILIDPARLGDFNQVLMDLGSDIESPVNPLVRRVSCYEFSGLPTCKIATAGPIGRLKSCSVPVYLTAFIIKW